MALYTTLKQKTSQEDVFPNIDTQNIPDSGVTTAKIADLAVTTAKIKDSSVTSAKIASNAVDTSQLANQAVTTTKIAGLSVTSVKLATNSVTTAKIVDSAVTTDKIADYSVTTDKIADYSVTTPKIASGSINGSKLVAGHYMLQDYDAPTLQDFAEWIEYHIKRSRHAVYDDGTEWCTIDSIYVGTSYNVTIRCANPLQGIATEIALTDEATYQAFLAGTAGLAFAFYGV